MNPHLFASEWIEAWNSKNINAIMAHYSENIDFSSPFIKQMGLNPEGNIRDKQTLKDYFGKALERNPQLHFDIQHILAGANSVVLFYQRMSKGYASEFMEFNTEGKVIRARAHYAVASGLPELMNDWADAWSNNLEKLLEFYHPDAFYSDPSLPEPIKGYQAISSYFSALFRSFPGWKWEVTELFLTTKGCTVKWKSWFPINEKNVILEGLDIVEIQDGKIIRNEVYFDRTELLKTLSEKKS